METKFECSICGKPTALADPTDPSKTFCEECCPDHEYERDPMTRRYHCEVCGKDAPEDFYLYHVGD
jgi:hypothetical protein